MTMVSKARINDLERLHVFLSNAQCLDVYKGSQFIKTLPLEKHAGLKQQFLSFSNHSQETGTYDQVSIARFNDLERLHVFLSNTQSLDRHGV